jgi:hypothetical protein
MGKIRRNGYVFIAWKGDHAPRHAHVYRKGKFVLKWDLENNRVMAGHATRKLVGLIRKLQEEGLI